MIKKILKKRQLKKKKKYFLKNKNEFVHAVFLKGGKISESKILKIGTHGDHDQKTIKDDNQTYLVDNEKMIVTHVEDREWLGFKKKSIPVPTLYYNENNMNPVDPYKNFESDPINPKTAKMILSKEFAHLIVDRKAEADEIKKMFIILGVVVAIAVIGVALFLNMQIGDLSDTVKSQQQIIEDLRDSIISGGNSGGVRP